jgi:hypothetical protein
VTDEQDHITVVLRECEARLRLLASEGRLTTGALAAFMELSATVQRETDRRKGDERRAFARLTADRRAPWVGAADDTGEVSSASLKASPAPSSEFADRPLALTGPETPKLP